MSVCAIDNPNTMCREAWQDGRLVYSVSVTILLARGFNGFPQFPFMLNYASPDGSIWRSGNYYGDLEAIPVGGRPEGEELINIGKEDT